MFNTIGDAIASANGRWPSLVFVEKNHSEACSPCPWCGGNDRFIIWIEGNYLCRSGDGHCNKEGWIDEEEQEQLTAVELRLLHLEIEQARQKRELEEHEQRITALEQMAQSQDHLRYHKRLDAHAIEYWHKQGINDESVDRWVLGYCDRCPMDRRGRPSYTIPVINRGKLRNIRHRLIGETGNSDKYRPHMKNLGNRLFGADFLLVEDKSMVILYEGEKKTIVAAQHGYPGPAIMGIQGFKPEWARWFSGFRKQYVCLDPDAGKEAEKIAGYFDNGYIVELPEKADDFFMLGGAVQEFGRYIREARKVG